MQSLVAIPEQRVKYEAHDIYERVRTKIQLRWYPITAVGIKSCYECQSMHHAIVRFLEVKTRLGTLGKKSPCIRVSQVRIIGESSG